MAAVYLHPCGASLTPAPVVDLRGAAARAGRRALLGALHLPAADWADRSMEFLPRWRPFALIVSRRDAASERRARLVAEHFGAPLEVVDADAELDAGGGDEAAAGAAAAFEAFVARAPPERVIVAGEAAADAEDARRQPRLWEPSPLLQVLLERRAEWLAAGTLRVLDAGCGTARNAVFLALALADAHVVAVDNRRAMVEKAAKFVARSGVSDTAARGAVEVVLGDIVGFIDDAATARGGSEAGGGHESTEPRFDAVLFMRFTHKAAIARAPSLLRRGRGGVIVVEGFHVSARHPTEREQLLEEGEVAELLRSADRAEVETLLEQRAEAEDGRPMLHVVIRMHAQA